MVLLVLLVRVSSGLNVNPRYLYEVASSNIVLLIVKLVGKDTFFRFLLVPITIVLV